MNTHRPAPAISLIGAPTDIGAGARGPVTEKIQSAFFDIVGGRNPKYAAWLTPV